MIKDFKFSINATIIIIEILLNSVVEYLENSKNRYAPLVKEIKDLLITVLNAIADKKLTKEEIEAIIKDAQDLIKKSRGEIHEILEAERQ